MFDFLFNKNKLPKKVELASNYQGFWDKIPLGKTIDSVITWNINDNNSLMIFGPTGSGKSIMIRTIIKYCLKTFDIHYIDILKCDAPTYANVATIYATEEDIKKCIHNLRVTKFEKPQLLLIEEIFELLCIWRKDNLDEIRDELLWLFEHGKDNNVFLAAASQNTPWKLKYDSIYWTEEWYNFFRKAVDASVVTSLERYHKGDEIEIYNREIPVPFDTQDAHIRGRGYIRIDNKLINYQAFYTSAV